jgi:leucyl aminopeptidase
MRRWSIDRRPVAADRLVLVDTSSAACDRISSDIVNIRTVTESAIVTLGHPCCGASSANTLNFDQKRGAGMCLAMYLTLLFW